MLIAIGDSTNKKHGQKRDKQSKKRKHDVQDSAASNKKFREAGDNTASGLQKRPSAISPFVLQRTSLYLPLSPISQSQALEGLCAEHLSPHILSYYAPLRGVLLSYSRAELSNRPAEDTAVTETVYAKTIDEYAFCYFWLTADFLFFRPARGSYLEGYITLQNENHMSLLCYNQFNATIERRHMPREWQWEGLAAPQTQESSRYIRAGSVANEEVDGYFTDGNGKRVDGLIKFRVLDYEGASDLGVNRAEGLLMIEGTLLEEADEDRLRRDEVRKWQKGKSKKMK